MRKIFSFLILLIVISMALTACGQKQNADNQQQDANALSGIVTLSGSTALQPLVEKGAQQFMVKHPKISVQVQGKGSGAGLTDVSQGAVNIGNSDIFAEEKTDIDASALKDHKLCVVGFATVVNPKVTVDNLTQKQLIDIFTGKVTNWKDVGGNDMKIVLINRAKSSGTRATFKKYALNGNEEIEALTEDSSGALRKKVAETDGAISYLALSYLDNTIKALKFEGVEPTTQNIVSGKYPIWSYEHMYTKGEATGATKAFLDYMLSDEVQKGIVSDPSFKFIPIADMKVSR